MKKVRALALLMAAGMTLSTTSAIISPTAWAATTPNGPVETHPMADLHNPYINDLTLYKAREDSGETIIRTENGVPLPGGTTLHLMGANITDTLRRDNGVLFSLNEGREYLLPWGYRTYNRLSVQQTGLDLYNDAGNTTTARVLVQYPDGSQDIIEAQLTIFPTLAQVKAVNYSSVTLTLGETITTSPNLRSTRTAGTQYALVESDTTEALREEGWEITIDKSSGDLTVTSPDTWATANVPVLAVYPDGTSQTVTASFRAEPYFEPSPTPPADEGRAFGSSSS